MRKLKKNIIPLVRRYAPESYEFGKFSHASDVWSFGITLWEMYSRGQVPYGEETPGFKATEMINNGERLSKPNDCPLDVYQIMLGCWNFHPQNRPTFEFLIKFFRRKHDITNQSLATTECEYICINDLSPENNTKQKEHRKPAQHLVINPEQLTIQNEIGQGSFGKVYKAELTYEGSECSIKVAVKTLSLKSDAEFRSEFLNEFVIMLKLNHPSIVSSILICSLLTLGFVFFNHRKL